MAQHPIYTKKSLLVLCVSILLLSFNVPAIAATPTPTLAKPGSYCPGSDVMLVAAEELSTGLNMVFRSRTALINKDGATAISELAAAGTTLQLASSRGAAARTNLLIDAIMQARNGYDYPQLLTWFPLLRYSLQTLPNDAAMSAADNLISQAEDILQGEKDGDPMKPLKEARHILACDGLDIPLQEAIKAHIELVKHLSLDTKSSAYDTLVNSLRSALIFTLKNNEN